MLIAVHVEHEIDQRPMHASQPAAHHGEPGAGQFGRALKVQPAVQGLTNIHVIPGFKRQRFRCAPLAHFHVVVFVITCRHRILRHIGNPHQKFTNFFLDRLGARHFAVQLRIDGLQGFCNLRLGVFHRHAGLDQFAHLLGGFLAIGLQLLGTDVCLLALGIQRRKRVKIQGVTAFGQRRFDRFTVLPQGTNIQHVSLTPKSEKAELNV